MKLLQELTKDADKTIKVPALKPRSTNYMVLANKKNAAGPMVDKKKELKAGRLKHKSSMYEDEIPSTGDRVEYDNYGMWKRDLPQKNTTFRTEANIEYAQTIGRHLEGISGKWNMNTNMGWIYEHYLDKKNLFEGKVIKVKEPGWYVVDHMDRAVEGPMQEGAARRAAAEMTDEVHSKGGKGDIPAYDVLYFTDYEIRRAKERAYESVEVSESRTEKQWFKTRSDWLKAVKACDVDDDGHNWAKMDGKLVAKWDDEKQEGWVMCSLTEGKWNDSGASDANGRWAKYAKGEIGVGAMATWLFNSRVHKKTKAEKLKSAYGAIAQQENTSKLISGAKADSLRAALKKKYAVSEGMDDLDPKQRARNQAEMGRGQRASDAPRDMSDWGTEYAYRVTFKSGASTSWKETHIMYDTVEDMAEQLKHPHEGDLGWITELVQPVLGIPGDEHSFYPEDYELISVGDDMLKVSIEYRIHHGNYDPTLVHRAVLTVQAT